MTLSPNVSQALWAYFRRQEIPREAPVSLVGLSYVFSPALPVSLSMKLDCSPVVHPAVAGSPQSILGQASVLLKGYLFFSHQGLVRKQSCVPRSWRKAPASQICPLGIRKAETLGAESMFGKYWLCPVMFTLVPYILQVT